jgi:hypothetical protein
MQSFKQNYSQYQPEFKKDDMARLQSIEKEKSKSVTGKTYNCILSDFSGTTTKLERFISTCRRIVDWPLCKLSSSYREKIEISRNTLYFLQNIYTKIAKLLDILASKGNINNGVARDTTFFDDAIRNIVEMTQSKIILGHKSVNSYVDATSTALLSDQIAQLDTYTSNNVLNGAYSELEGLLVANEQVISTGCKPLAESSPSYSNYKLLLEVFIQETGGNFEPPDMAA